MKTTELFQQKTVFSFEIFPPKRTADLSGIYRTLDGLKHASPDFISVTYGALGSQNHDETFRIAGDIKKKYHTEGVAHLACVGLTKAEVKEKLNILSELGVENVLALRGDLPENYVETGDFKYASDLVSFIKENSNLNVLAACYPEIHVESGNAVDDIFNLKKKVDAGADHLVSQLFLDNEAFYAFRERCQLAQVNVPIEAGIMPVLNKKQIERITALCGAAVPKKFRKMMDKYQDNPVAMQDAGIAYAIDQIVDLLIHGVDGIHLYTMNKPEVAQRIYDATHNLFEVKVS